MSFLRSLLRSRTTDERRAVAIKPTDRAATIGAIEAQLQASSYPAALAAVDQALADDGADGTLVMLRGSILYSWGRFREAITEYLRAQSLGISSTRCSFELGWCYFSIGEVSQARAALRKVVDAEPERSYGWASFAQVLSASGDMEGARTACERALQLDPSDARCWDLLGNIRLKLKQPDQAEVEFRRAISLSPTLGFAWSNLGVALSEQGRYVESGEAHAHAVRLESDDADGAAFVNYAMHLSDVGEIERATEVLQQHLPDRPNLDGHHAYALALLTAGRFPEGWAQYESRWLRPLLNPTRPRFPVPPWSGQSLAGKTILLRTEQGVGDAIQFIRYAAPLRKMGASVVLQTSEPGRFLGSADAVDRISCGGEALPDFDFYAHLMSLPGILGTQMETIPSEVPYIAVDERCTMRWRQRLPDGSKLNVGVVWAGNPQHHRDRSRSIPLNELGPLLEVPDVAFFGLQKGPRASEASGLESHRLFVNLADDLHDFSDTAAAINALDLTICVDTAVAHLAGALGKPVWLLVPKPSDWRWLTERDDSPWYPTMRIFRQTVRDQWSDVVARVSDALRARRDDHRSGIVRATDDAPAPAQRAQVTAARTQLRRPASKGDISAFRETREGIVQYLPDRPPMGQSIHEYGEYLNGHLLVLAALLRKGAVVVEAGAGIGMHTLALARIIGPSGHLLVYEGEGYSRRILHNNLAANAVTNVTVMKQALRGSNPDSHAAGVSDGDPGSPRAHPKTETVDELRLASLQLLKMNDPASAPQILEGASETLWRLRPHVFSICGEDDDDLMAILDRFGYRCRLGMTPFFRPDNYDRRPEDVFGGRTVRALVGIPEERSDVLLPTDWRPAGNATV